MRLQNVNTSSIILRVLPYVLIRNDLFVSITEQIDGTFRVEKPPVLLGYTNETRRSAAAAAAGGPAEDGMGQVGHGDNTYLTMFVTIEPPLKQADPVKEKVTLLLKVYVCIGVESQS